MLSWLFVTVLIILEVYIMINSVFWLIWFIVAFQLGFLVVDLGCLFVM